MLYFIIGLPRSGKSTLCDQWVKFGFDIRDGKQHVVTVNIKGSNPPRVVVCSDDIRMALHGCRWNSVAEETVNSIQGVMIRSLLNRGFDVVVDGTHTTKVHIERMIRFCPSEVDYLYIDCSPEICKERAIKTGQEDLYTIINRMADNLTDLVSIHCGYKRSFLQYPEFPEHLNRVVKRCIDKYVKNPPANTVVEN